MKNSVRKKFLATLVTFCICCSLSIPVFAATVGSKWYSTPITIYATTQMSNYEIEQLKQAIAVWNNTRVGTVLKYGGVKSFILKPGQDGLNTIGKIKLINDNLAKTDIWRYDNIEIFEGDILLNSDIQYYNGSYYNLRSVLIHELGHFLGLADCNDINSIMYKYYTGRTTLSADDINDLDSLY